MHCNDMRMMRSWFSYSLKEERFASFSVDPSPQIVLMRSDWQNSTMTSSSVCAIGGLCGWERNEKKTPALGASAYLLVCRRHATLLALCNTHSGWGGAGAVWVVLTVPGGPSVAAAAAAVAATAQHVTTLDHVTACCATIGARPFLWPVGSAPGGHYSGAGPCCTSGLGHKHGHAPRGASSHGDCQTRAGGGGLCAWSRLTFVILGSCALGVQRRFSVREVAGAARWEKNKDFFKNV